MAEEVTSEEIASLAGSILAAREKDGIAHTAYNTLLRDAKRLAGSALTQREPERDPEQGTHAYDLLAAFAKSDLENTEALIEMVAATVLYKLAMEEGKGRSNISISPLDMDEMWRAMEVTSNRDGMVCHISISPREKETQSLYVDIGNTYIDEDVSKAKPQAEAVFANRPVWAIRWSNEAGTHLAKMLDELDARRQYASFVVEGFAPPQIENRHCMHIDCPTEKCTHEGF